MKFYLSLFQQPKDQKNQFMIQVCSVFKAEQSAPLSHCFPLQIHSKWMPTCCCLETDYFKVFVEPVKRAFLHWKKKKKKTLLRSWETFSFGLIQLFFPFDFYLLFPSSPSILPHPFCSIFILTKDISLELKWPLLGVLVLFFFFFFLMLKNMFWSTVCMAWGCKEVEDTAPAFRVLPAQYRR